MINVKTEPKFNIGFRAVIFLAISFLAYGMAMYYMFDQHNVLTSMLFVLIFFLFAHFTYLHFLGLKPRYLAWFLLFLIALNLLIFGDQGIFMIFCNVFFHAAVFMLIWYIDGSSHNVINFDSWSYFTSGGYMFTVFITIARSFSLLGLYQKFPFTCQQLSETSNNVIDYVAAPLKLSINKAEKIKKSTKEFFAMKMSDVVGGSQVFDQNVFSENKKNGQLINNILVYKKKYLDQPMKDNDDVNMGICDYLLERVESVYQNTTFQVSIIILLFLLLYGFIRITFRVMTVLGFLLFKILCLFNVYKFEKKLVEADKLL